MADFSMKDIRKRMDGALEAMRRDFAGLRTGRASASLVEPVMVPAYGGEMPLNQVGTVSVPEPRMIAVQVWDKSLVKAAEKAIRNAGLGLNPATEGQTIRVPIPELSEERRNELAKIAARYAESARVAVRNVRRDGMDQLKRMERDGTISQDEQRSRGERIQELTDEHIAAINEALAAKEAEITTV